MNKTLLKIKEKMFKKFCEHYGKAVMFMRKNDTEAFQYEINKITILINCYIEFIETDKNMTFGKVMDKWQKEYKEENK